MRAPRLFLPLIAAGLFAAPPAARGDEVSPPASDGVHGGEGETRTPRTPLPELAEDTSTADEVEAVAASTVDEVVAEATHAAPV